MVNRVRLLRSNTFGIRPAAGSRQAGEPYVNTADNQLGVIDNAGNARDLVGVPYFSTLSNYAAGQSVNFQGKLYSALVAMSAGAFDITKWTPVATQDWFGQVGGRGGFI